MTTWRLISRMPNTSSEFSIVYPSFCRALVTRFFLHRVIGGFGWSWPKKVKGDDQ